MNQDTQRNFIYFMFYSILGWCYEVFLEVVVYKWGFSNRGVLFGPYCPVYGFGAISFIMIVYPLIKHKKAVSKIIMLPTVFLLCMLIATIIELSASYVCEYFFGSWPWQTYINYTYNFQGRIALSPSIRFGIGGIIFLYLLQPLFEKFCTNIGRKNVRLLSTILFLIILCDCIYTFVF